MTARGVLQSIFCLAAGCALLAGPGCTARAPRTSAAFTPAAEAPKQSPRTLFLAKCSLCHEPERAYAHVASRDEWIPLVARMAVRNREWITTEEMKGIVSYHRYHETYVNHLFQAKCGACHQRSDLQALKKNSSQWKTVIRFMGERQAGGLSAGEKLALYYSLTRT